MLQEAQGLLPRKWNLNPAKRLRPVLQPHEDKGLASPPGITLKQMGLEDSDKGDEKLNVTRGRSSILIESFVKLQSGGN